MRQGIHRKGKSFASCQKDTSKYNGYSDHQYVIVYFRFLIEFYIQHEIKLNFSFCVVMQAKVKAKAATSAAIAAVSNQTTSTTSIAPTSVPAVVTSTITTQPMHSGQPIIHSGVQGGPSAQPPPNSQQQPTQPPPPHNLVASHIPILMDPLVQSNYLISI